jgi:hypothetical protein
MKYSPIVVADLKGYILLIGKNRMNNKEMPLGE